MAVMAFTSIGHASTTASLDYRADEGCPDAARFIAEVSARLGRVPFETEDPNVVRVRVRSDESEWVATLELADGSSQVHRAPTCAASASLAATALADVLGASQLAEGLAAPTAASNAPPVASPPNLPPAPSPPSPTFGHPTGTTSPTVRVRVRFESTWNREGFLHLRTGSAVAYVRGARSPIAEGYSFAPVCQMPCETQLPAGTLSFGVSLGTGATQPVSGAVSLTAPTELFVRHRSRLIHRVVGWVLFLGGMGLGAAGALTLITDGRPGLVGAITGGVLALVGFPMTLLRDRYTVTSTPL